MVARRDASSLKPWTLGAFELLRHAGGNARRRSDTDRRIALIGFDQMVEVAIEAFVGLHPTQRHGQEVGKDVQAKIRSNFNEKLSSWMASPQRGASRSAPVDVMLFYHQIRDGMYHEGNGVTPEEHVVRGARAAAIATFNTLFQEDVEPLLAEPGEPSSSADQLRVDAVAGVLPIAEAARGEGALDPDLARALVLQSMVSLENELRLTLPEARDTWGQALWRQFVLTAPVPPALRHGVDTAIQLRNQLVHARVVQLTEVEVEAAIDALGPRVKSVGKPGGTRVLVGPTGGVEVPAERSKLRRNPGTGRPDWEGTERRPPEGATPRFAWKPRWDRWAVAHGPSRL